MKSIFKFISNLEINDIMHTFILCLIPILIIFLFNFLGEYINLKRIEFEQKCISYYVDNNGYKLYNCDYYIKKLEEKND